MKWVSAITILGFTAMQAIAGVPTGRQAAKTAHTSSKATAKTSSHAKAVNHRKQTPAAHTKTSKSAVKTSRSRYTHAKRRSAPAPSYQLHPDPERYEEIQKALADRGYFKGDVNGVWGDDSTDALKRFQADRKLPDDGKISSLTLIGLGLGPKHEGKLVTPPAASASSNVAVPPPLPEALPESAPEAPATPDPQPPR